MKERYYSEKTTPNHRVVRCATGRGLTNVFVTFRPSPSEELRGYYITCDQFKDKHFQYMKANEVIRSLEDGVLTEEGKSFKFKTDSINS